jgi:hypothetical protein
MYEQCLGLYHTQFASTPGSRCASGTLARGARGPSTGSGSGVRSRRASGTVRARVAAITSRRHVPPGAGPPPAVAGECGRVARAALCVLVSLRSRRADGGTRMCRPARTLHRPWLRRAVASSERHCACSCRCDRVAPMAAHACAAR